MHKFTLKLYDRYLEDLQNPEMIMVSIGAIVMLNCVVQSIIYSFVVRMLLWGSHTLNVSLPESVQMLIAISFIAILILTSVIEIRKFFKFYDSVTKKYLKTNRGV